jgi:FtsH-binding integral membrane protein
MPETVLAFVIWSAIGLLFIGMGIYAFFTKKPQPMGFWANAKMFEVTDVKKYNAAMGKLFMGFGVVFIALGLPLLSGQNSPLIILSMFGVMAETIFTMAIYTLVIEKKYKKK